MADEEEVLVREQRGNVLVLRLNRPEKRNALNGALMGALGEGLHEAETNPDIRAVVLTGTGDRSFCAGMDLAAFSSGGSTAPQASPEGMAAFGRFFGGGDIDVPIVGAAQATAVAGGFELLLNCDVVVAGESAQFGIPEV
jgi:enoyl-CoA hydratase/carnithine racemase